MRRCFSQQYEVRKELYENLPKVFEKKLELSESIGELLLSQFIKCISSNNESSEDDDETPLHLSACLEGKPEPGSQEKMNVKQHEPFPTLFTALTKCLISKGSSGKKKGFSESVIF